MGKNKRCAMVMTLTSDIFELLSAQDDVIYEMSAKTTMYMDVAIGERRTTY